MGVLAPDCCRRSGLNRRPAAYKAAALPLSYGGDGRRLYASSNCTDAAAAFEKKRGTMVQLRFSVPSSRQESACTHGHRVAIMSSMMRSAADAGTRSGELRDIAGRIDALDWQRISRDLETYGNAVVASLLTAPECRMIADWYPGDAVFRSRVVMASHGFGRGEYKYFGYPLPELVAKLRAAFYPQLAPIANRWNEQLRLDVRYPATHAKFLSRCHEAGQTRPTPLLLQYGAGDYNCLHQDLYGECVFPLQMTILLSEPGEGFTGGEFIMTEQRPRLQSRLEVVPLRRGDAAIFAVHHRPVSGTRGAYRVNLRHGVSRVRSGQRHTLGVIFHDAK
jgi:uncharacterized protein